MSIIALIVLNFVTLGLSFFMKKELLLSTYAEGRRQALRDAAAYVREQADDDLRTAPRGELQYGVVRAQVAHEIALELRSMISRIS